MTITQKRGEAGSVIWYDASLLQEPDDRVFDPDWLRQGGYHEGHSTGRFEAHFLRLKGRAMVLRHYYRGGLIGRVVKDLFLWQPVGHSRAMKEFHLLRWMRHQGLPVPEPVAARYAPVGPCYRADLLMERIAEARTLADCLRDSALSEADWGRIGAVIGQMHAVGVDHTDLNCRNILLDAQGKVWLIDFDKCSQRAAGAWQGGNLARLRRSLDKENSRQTSLHWSDAAWSALIAGYEDARP